MNQKTFDIIAKYIAKQDGITIKYDHPQGGASANLDTKTIHLPDSIKETNVLSALTLLMHESAHLRYTKIPPTVADGDQINHTIINAIEDVRIDGKNMSRLSNVRGFYNKLYEDSQDRDSNAPLPLKALCNAILRMEGFPQYGFKDKETDDFVSKINLTDEMQDALGMIECGRWDDLKDKVAHIRTLLGIPPPDSNGNGHSNGNPGTNPEQTEDKQDKSVGQNPGVDNPLGKLEEIGDWLCLYFL